MTQPQITLSDGIETIVLDQDLFWSDEFTWAEVEQSVERSIPGSLVIDVCIKKAGRPITLQGPAENAAWMLRSDIERLQAWEKDPTLILKLGLRGRDFSVVFRRYDGAPVEANPVDFVANPDPGGFGDWYLTTIKFLTVE